MALTVFVIYIWPFFFISYAVIFLVAEADTVKGLKIGGNKIVSKFPER